MVRTFSLVVLGTIAALIVGCGKAKNNAAVEETIVGSTTASVIVTPAKPAVPAIPAIPLLGIAARAGVPAVPAVTVPRLVTCVDVSISPKLTAAELAAAQATNNTRLRTAPGAVALRNGQACKIVPATKFVCVHTTADKKGKTTKTRRVYEGATTQAQATTDCKLAKGVLQARTK